MPEALTEVPENAHENAAFSPDSPQESPEVPQITTEATKQFPLRLPVAVIIDIENEVKTRLLRGEELETAMYCRRVLRNHRKAYSYDADMNELRRENAALTQRILELQLRDENPVIDSEATKGASEESRVLIAMRDAIKKAALDFAEEGFCTAEYYESVVSHYFNQILPQIPQ